MESHFDLSINKSQPKIPQYFTLIYIILHITILNLKKK